MITQELMAAPLPEILDNPGERLTSAVFDSLYETLFPRVYNYFSYRTGSREEAEDLTAQVFERMITHYRQFDARRGSFEGWLFTIARNLLTSQGRSRKRHPQVELDETLEDNSFAGPDQQLLRQEELSRLRQYIDQLPERDRELIALRYGASLSQRQVGQILKMNENSVAVALGRALRRLRRLFDAEEIG